MLGEKFRELRKSKKITIVEACRGITSPSSLQRWERGEGQMAIEKVIKLLNRIHIEPKEYIDRVDISDDDVYYQDIGEAYNTGNSEMLKNLAIFLLDLHRKDLKNKHILFQAAIACNYYMDLTKLNIFPKEDTFRLNAYLANIEDWTQEDVIIFHNTQLLLSTENIFKFARSLYSFLIEEEKITSFYLMAVNALLSAAFVLLKRKNLASAQEILNQVKNLDLPEKYVIELIKIKYISALVDYIENNDDTMLKSLVKNLSALGLTEKAQDFKVGFEQIKEMYH